MIAVQFLPDEVVVKISEDTSIEDALAAREWLSHWTTNKPNSETLLSDWTYNFEYDTGRRCCILKSVCRTYTSFTYADHTQEARRVGLPL